MDGIRRVQSVNFTSYSRWSVPCCTIVKILQCCLLTQQMPLKGYCFINSGTSKNNKYTSTLNNSVLAIAYLQNLNKNNNRIPKFAQVRSKELAGRLVTDCRQNHKQKPTLRDATTCWTCQRTRKNGDGRLRSRPSCADSDAKLSRQNVKIVSDNYSGSATSVFARAHVRVSVRVWKAKSCNF